LEGRSSHGRQGIRQPAQKRYRSCWCARDRDSSHGRRPALGIETDLFPRGCAKPMSTVTSGRARLETTRHGSPRWSVRSVSCSEPTRPRGQRRPPSWPRSRPPAEASRHIDACRDQFGSEPIRGALYIAPPPNYAGKSRLPSAGDSQRRLPRCLTNPFALDTAPWWLSHSASRYPTVECSARSEMAC
jgi:hypothetical protein